MNLFIVLFIDKTKNQEDKNEKISKMKKFQKPLTNLPKSCTIDCTNS